MKKQKNFRLDEDTLDYIHNFGVAQKLANDTDALNQIIEDHKHRNDIPASKLLVESLAKMVAEELKDTLTRIRLAANNADRNSDIILMLLNSQISYSGYKTLIEKETPQLKQARQIEKDRIAHYRQKKLDKPDPKKSAEPELILDEDLLM